MCPQKYYQANGYLTISCKETDQKKRNKAILTLQLKTPYINDATRKRRVERAVCLLEKLETNPIIIERAIF